METIPVSKFKATCLAVVQRVKRTGRPVLITRFGEPVAEVVPPTRRASRGAWLGSMQGSVEVLGDEVGPVLDAKRWDAVRK
jgi:prevent-host-death family protein